jgi:hypothetical protein
MKKLPKLCRLTHSAKDRQINPSIDFMMGAPDGRNFTK